MFHKLLIANRGEIACRVARTARRLGVSVAAVYSDVDAHALHVRLADEAWPIGAGPAAQSYLNIGNVIDAARKAGAQAIHPGYGFLSENPQFAAACQDAGIVFVGPPVSAMEAMASKSAAKERMSKAGVPVLPGYHGDEQTTAALERRAKELGFPLIIKPSAGGGGKGMQIVNDAAELRAAIEGAQRIARAAFKDDRLLLERYLPAPRHVEVQVFADQHGHIVHLFDRDCSVQRRHQKLIEEAPAPGLDDDVRAGLYAAACAVAREVGYVGAGTIEFLLSGRDFYFMEMNTRLQVEHPVTEMITGLDLVEWQLRVACGERLPLEQSQIRRAGHAIEVRHCAEDAEHDFVPSAGKLERMRWPETNESVRVDDGFREGDVVPALYDSLLGKIVAHGEARDAALDTLLEAVAQVRVVGLETNASWLVRALEVPAFRRAQLSTAFIAQNSALLTAPPDPRFAAACAGFMRLPSTDPRDPHGSPWDLLDGFRMGQPRAVRIPLLYGTRRLGVDLLDYTNRHAVVRVDGQTFELQHGAGEAVLDERGESADVLTRPHRSIVWRRDWKLVFTLNDGSQYESATAAHAGGLTTPLPGVVVSVAVKEGDPVTAGQTLLVIEAMKMEHAIKAPRAGIVKSLKHKAGDRVREGSALAEIE
jgi:3-methylcrotonyl-CoA carboxylase alpha subunit